MINNATNVELAGIIFAGSLLLIVVIFGIFGAICNNKTDKFYENKLKEKL